MNYRCYALLPFIPALPGFFPNGIEIALFKNEPVYLATYLAHNKNLPLKEKKRYLKEVKLLIIKHTHNLEPFFATQDVLPLLRGLGLIASGLLSMTMAYLINHSRSSLRTERVGFVVSVGGGMLTVFGLREIYRSFTKHYRFLEYYKALALKDLLEKIPTT